ncbi:MAG TPA: NAD-dependent epimerase/dehydratase family protein [Candidatus Saccharimonadia bacterium]|nr:NAD-dependent epimerase/dehydratase family protein [Candidatus Saccharimonadia bacterium]
MRVLVTGACGFVGSRLLRRLREGTEGWTLLGMDNLCRPGSEQNRPVLKDLGVGFFHGDVRCASDFDNLPPVDWVIDAAANPSVLAGIDGLSSSRQVIEHNLQGTVNMLEYCRRHGAGFVLLSTSRVYGVEPLSALPVRGNGSRFELNEEHHSLPPGVSARGVAEEFSTTPPLSLYGVSKKMSEDLALEYASAFSIPVHINRCGVMAGAGQFGRADQGIVAFWIHSWRERRPLRYLGFGGKGLQVRDVVHPDDVASLVLSQIQQGEVEGRPRVLNVAGGPESTFSLAELSAWCEQRFGYKNDVEQDGSERPFDIAWLALDDSKTRSMWDWRPEISRDAIFSEVARFADASPAWMHVST